MKLTFSHGTLRGSVGFTIAKTPPVGGLVWAGTPGQGVTLQISPGNIGRVYFPMSECPCLYFHEDFHTGITWGDHEA